MHYYELLLLDADRTRSIWVTHDQAYTTDEFTTLFETCEAEITLPTKLALSHQSREMRRSVFQLGQSLNVAPPLLDRLGREPETPLPVYGDVIEAIVDHLCETRGFRRLTPTAVAVRYGQDVVTA